MASTPEIEAALFKQVDGGYIFQAANPWVFGPTTRYIVSAGQKAAILSVIVPRRPWLRVAAIVAAVTAWVVVVATIMSGLSPHPNPQAVDMFFIAILALVPMYLAWVAVLRHRQRRLQPILASAPRTEELITAREIRGAMADALSLRRTLAYAALWGFVASMQTFNLFMRNARHPLFTDVQSYVNLFAAVVAAFLVVRYLGIAIRKLRQKPATC